jgi:hypothetical protein
MPVSPRLFKPPTLRSQVLLHSGLPHHLPHHATPIGMMGYEVQIGLQTLAFPDIAPENPKSYFTPLDPLRNGVLSPSACWLRGFAYGAPKFLPHKIAHGRMAENIIDRRIFRNYSLLYYKRQLYVSASELLPRAEGEDRNDPNIYVRNFCTSRKDRFSYYQTSLLFKNIFKPKNSRFSVPFIHWI